MNDRFSQCALLCMSGLLQTSHISALELWHTLYSLCIAVVAGPSSSSVPECITDDVALASEQSSKARGEHATQGNDNQTGRDILLFTSG